MTGHEPLVSVVMPAFRQAAFLPRAVASLLGQTLGRWELLVVADGDPDATARALAPQGDDPRIALLRGDDGPRGLGRALNAGLDAARAPVVAYLPCDDVLAPAHLESLTTALHADPAAVAAVAEHDGAPDPVLQLVQVAHRRTADRWLERDALESDDLGRLLWDALRARGPFVATGAVTCTWTAHPGQRHRAIRASCDGGPNVFRRRYGSGAPLRLHSSEADVVDEVALYAADRRRAPTPRAPDGLRILLAGELAYNADRVLALEERGHALSGLWIDDPLGFNTVGPLPFGHVRELAAREPRAAVREARPDVVYALLNWRAIGLAHALLDAGAPVVWHFKEAPQRAIVRGTWPQLADLHARAAGVVYATALERDWFETALPGRRDPDRVLVLDGDLPRARWQAGALAPRLSEADGRSHLALLGRPAGVAPAVAGRLAGAGVELHVHGLARTPAGRAWLAAAREAAGERLHVHGALAPPDWVPVLSRYDGGLLHHVPSANGGDLARAAWDDLNQPARVSTLLAAGLPLLQRASPGSRNHMQDLIATLGAGMLYADEEDLAARLAGERRDGAARAAALRARAGFAFEPHADRLLAFLRRAAEDR